MQFTHKVITSSKNELIKYVLELQKNSKFRHEKKEFVIEGEKEILFALENNFVIKKILFNNKRIDYKSVSTIYHSTEIIECSNEVFEKMSYRNTIYTIGIAEHKPNTFTETIIEKNPFFIIVEAVEKPGNLGAILRTADAANASAVIVCEPLADIYNPNVIRSSVGCLFTVPVVIASNKEVISFLKANKISVFTTYLHTDSYYYHADFTKPCAIIFGTEDKGVSNFWIDNANELIKIPMLGKNDSLNVSNAAAIMAYEVIRQRIFRKI